MNKALFAIIIVIGLLAGGGYVYKTYMQSHEPSASQILTQPKQQTQLPSGSGTTNSAVDKSSSPQEQQAQQNLNSLDNGNHN